MESHKGLFQTVGDKMDQILSLADLEEEQMIQSVDRTAVAGASYFTSVDQSSVHSAEVGSHQKERLLTSVDLPGSKKTQGEKFFLIHTAEWQTTNALFHEVAKLDVVNLLYNEEFAVQGLLKYHTYGRFGVEVQVQINPTPFQQGGLIAAMVPADQGYGSIASLTVYPHGLLNCNINNVVRIKVPFIYTRGAYNFRDPQYPVWELTIRVWSQLYIGTGTTPYTTVNVLARFCDLELHGLTPLTQMMRNEFRVSTTENVVNLSNYQDSKAKISFALDQEDWLSDPSEAGGLKITNFSTWTQIPTLASQFAFNSSATVGTQIKVLPVDPYFFQVVNTSPNQKCITSLASICQMFCFWRGDLVFDFQVFPTKYHSGRLLFCFVPGNETMDVSRVTLKKATTGPCAVMDITGVQSTLRFRVPWISDTPYRVNKYTKAAHVKGEYAAIGKLIVFVYNRLSNPSNVAQHVLINVYMSAVNLELFAPIYHVMTDTQTQAGDDSMGFSTTVTAEQNPLNPEGGITTPKDLKGKANKGKMDIAGVKAPVGAVTTIEDPLLAKKTPETFPEVKPGKSRHTSDHMSLYKFMGRAHFLGTFTFTANNMEYTFPLTLSSTSDPPRAMPSTLRWFFNLFQLYRGPLDLTIIITGATDVDGMVWFTPVGLAVDTPWTEKTSALSIDYKSSLGAVRFNTRRTGNIQVRMPWYSYLYAVSGVLDGTGDTSDSTFGLVSIQITNYNHLDEYLSFSLYLSVTDESEFYFPRAPLNSNAMKSSDGVNVRERIAEGDLESSVDDPRTPADYKFERSIERVPFKPYKELRMDVAKKRLQYAKEELHSQASTALVWFKDTQVDINLNWREMQLNPSGKRYFAISDGKSGYVWRLTHGVFVKESSNGWSVLSPEPSVTCFLDKLFLHKDWSSINFGNSLEISENAKMCFKENSIFFKRHKISLQDVIKFLDFIEPRSIDLADRIVGLSGVRDLTDSGRVLVEDARSFLDEMKISLKSALFGFKKNMTVKIIRLVMTILKTGILAYASQKLTEINRTDIVSLLETINWIDVGISALDLGNVISEMLSTIFEWQVDTRLIQLRTQSISNWLRDISCGINIFKNFKDATVWIYKKIKDYYDKNYGWKKNVLEVLKENEDKIESLLEQADNFCLSQIQDVSKLEEFDKGVKIVKSLRTIQSLVMVDNDLKNFINPIRDAIARVHSKLKSLGAINQAMVTRCEPVVCYLYGKRGGGKSLTSLALATKICKYFGLEPAKNIYTKPVSSTYWDGYCGQLVCIIDDIGQNTTDEDWSDFCQLVSGCPMRLNMAALEEKGRHFSSPFIICTSNFSDPSPKTVYVKEAIDRRLHYKVEVKPAPIYTNHSDNTLNVSLAKGDGTIADMSCVELICRDQKITLKILLESLIQSVNSRQKNVEEFIKLWSQSGDDDFSDEFSLLFEDCGKPNNRRLTDLFDAIRNHKWYILGVALGVVGLATSAWMLYKKFRSEDPETPTEGVYHGVTRPKQVIKLDAEPADSQSTLEIASLVRKNLVQFGIGEKGGCVRWVMNALGVKDDWILVPSHAYKFEPNYETLEFYFNRSGTYYSISAGNVIIHSLDVGFQDVVLMKVPTIPKFRDITDHFIKKKDLDKAVSRLATLVTTVGGTPMMISEGPLKFEEKASYHHKMPDGETVELTVDMAWRGKGEGIPGMCGGALVSSNQSIQNAIVGIHVAGGHGIMVSKTITKEMLDAVDTVKIESQRIMKVEFTQSSLNVVSKTLFRKSPIYDMIDKQMINYPAILPFNKNVEIDPIDVMLSKYSLPIVEEPKGYDEVCVFYRNKILGKDWHYYEPLDYEQAIQGVYGMEPINMKSSPGYPYVQLGYTKEDLIFKDSAGMLVGIHPYLHDRLKFNLALLDAGNDLDVVYVTCPKDELRPIEKVRESKTRAIDACPLDFTIICRMLWGPAITYFQLNPGFHTGSAVGINPDSDWDPLFKSMISFGDYAIDLDFSAFDASLSPFMIFRACEVLSILSGLSDVQNRVLSNAIIYSKHYLLNMVYYVLGSMPSGSPCTSLLNSIANNINLYYVLSQIFRKQPICFYEKVRIICYGDDVMIVFARDLDISKLQSIGVRLQQEFKKLGMTVTSGDKKEPRIVSISDLTFLKRKFLLVDDRIRPAISEKTIWSMLAWNRSNAEFEQNVETACWFAFMHGFEYYTQFSGQLQHMLDRMLCGIKLKNYDWWRMLFNSQDFLRDLT
nr:MAG: polyprotein [Picornaviridae sp.]